MTSRRARKKSQFQVELDKLIREVEDEDCATSTDTHQVTEELESLPVGKQNGKQHEIKKITVDCSVTMDTIDCVTQSI